MSLSAGDKLGPYEILTLIGAGGMGEVYRARDSRLSRDVAIKVSHAEFSERFAREARAVAALNHPNICTLYDVGPNYLVMEYIEGEAPQGPYPLDDALRIAEQIRDALEAAHEKGVVHRDLKPANIKIRPDGTVKVLDFGLAKALPERSAAEEHSILSTEAMPLTQAGVVLGTPAYMAPEQAGGKEVGKQADIWAFGVVLYEILTGRRLFEGKTVSDTLTAVLVKEPDLSGVDAKVRGLLGSCLQKDPKQRLRDIGDAWRLLDVGAGHIPPDRVARARPLPWAVAGAFAVALAAALWALWRNTRPADRPLVRLDVDLGSDVSLSSQNGPSVILSPDGSRLVYVSQNRLFTRRLDQPKAAELAGTDGAFAPFFSPDGQWVAFFAPGKLRKISVEGGAAVALCDATQGAGGAWGEDGNIIASLNTFGGLSRIPSSGGKPTPASELAQGEVTHRWPQILPGGKAVLFTAHGTNAGFDGANIEVLSLGNRQVKMLQKGGTYGRYLPSGHLIYVNRGTLFAVPFDPETLEMRGAPVPVLQEVAYNRGNGSAKLGFMEAPSGPGTLVYQAGGVEGGGLVTVQWMDRAGKTQPLLTKPDFYLAPRLSPDGQRLALSATDIWIYEWQRDTMTRLTFGGGSSDFPAWSPDGRYIVFRKVGEGLLWTRSDGAGKPQPLTQSRSLQVPYSFTPDARRLVFQEVNATTGYDLWTVPVESDGTGLRAGKPEIFLQTQFDERWPSFSPDGRWLAYGSNESGAYQVYVRAFPDKGGKWQVSGSGGVYPRFARNGQELFFRTEDNQIMATSYTVKGDSFVADKPRPWSETRIADIGLNGMNYDPAPDGKRVAALMPAEAPEDQKAQTHVIFLQNFFDEVRRRTAASGK